MKLWLDLETYCEVPIAHGTHAYAAAAEVMLFAWALDNGPVSVWDVASGEPVPEALLAGLSAATEVWAHNSHFDRTVLSHALPHLCPALPVWRDTMVQAMSHALPAALAVLCELLKVPADKAKDKTGKQLIQLFCKPRPLTSALRRATRETHPVEWSMFVEYAALDIEAMREVHRRLPTWNYKGTELDLWHLDQRINDRGVMIDMALVAGAIDAVAQAQAELAQQTVEMTGGQVASATKRDALLLHVLEAYGVDLPDLQMATLERRMQDPDLPAELKELLAIRLQASTTSTSKYKTLAKGTSADHRLRGTLQFNGASRTGRWAGRLFQPQNLPRPSLDQADIELGIEALKAGCADLVTDNVMALTSSAIRSCIISAPGKKLVIADLSNIEGRVQSWLAGEDWKLDAFRAYDAGTGPDLYKLAYSKSFGVKPESVTKDQRQVGKVQELALGYAGGVGAFVTFASAYGIDLEALAKLVLPLAPGWAVDEASKFYDWTVKQQKPMLDMSRDAFVACETLKRGWRNAHPQTAMLWTELEFSVKAAIAQPGTTMDCRRLKIRRDGSWLRVGLPSGRAICYPNPELVAEKEDGPTAITYMGMNQYTRKWCRLTSYGGKIFENICQAVARDVMTHNMPIIEAAGYATVLTVHDEVLCETPDTPEFNTPHLASLLAAPPPWAPDMPLAAAGFETHVYKKD